MANSRVIGFNQATADNAEHAKRYKQQLVSHTNNTAHIKVYTKHQVSIGTPVLSDDEGRLLKHACSIGATVTAVRKTHEYLKRQGRV